ncbi:hypothetical protein V8G54_027636 [Vigna mungo]|uniref:B box-type domain-containing protein n=1 Tax=Vigna mungo TaxID=3915 RepID=A0AAQ3N2Z8_VIGMU
MKIQCNVCEAAEAKVLCCADEAALCWECDEKVHAANKLASKHQRVPLSTSSSHMPKCDICQVCVGIAIAVSADFRLTCDDGRVCYPLQEALGYFFCLEDRALFCRKCDLAIHTANAYVSGHQRFLLTGVRVGLEATEPGASSSSLKSDSGEKISDTKSSPISRKVSTEPQNSDYNELLPIQGGGVGGFPPAKESFGGGSTVGNISQWTIDEFIGLNEFSQNYDYMEGSTRSLDSSLVIDKLCVVVPLTRAFENRTGMGPIMSAKVLSLWLYGCVIFFFTSSFLDEYVQADSGKLGDSDSPVLRSGEEEMEEEEEEYLEHVPDSSWTVPQIPSPPTASGLHWPKHLQYSSNSLMFVPDISFSHMQQHSQISSIVSRRRRHLQ